MHSAEVRHSVRIVDDLEQDGLVTRSFGATDRRTVCVTLTRGGQARRITNERIGLLCDEIERLDPADRAALDRIGRRIEGLRSAERVCRLTELSG